MDTGAEVPIAVDCQATRSIADRRRGALRLWRLLLLTLVAQISLMAIAIVWSVV